MQVLCDGERNILKLTKFVSNTENIEIRKINA